VQGIGAGLDVRGAVVSPTFVIARVHRPARAGGESARDGQGLARRAHAFAPGAPV
jgi:hypothetical protein